MVALLLMPFFRAFDFLGRSARVEFWIFLLLSIVLQLVAATIDGLLGHGVDPAHQLRSSGPFGLTLSAILLVPTLAVSVRRLHDTDRSGWRILLSLIPILGWIALLFWYCTGGTPGENAYGDDPRDAFY